MQKATSRNASRTAKWKKVVRICNNSLDCFHSMSLHYIYFTVPQRHGIKLFFCDGPRPKETQSVASNSSPQTTEGLAIIALISLMLKHKGIASPQGASTLLAKGRVIVELSDILICPSFQLPLCVVLCSGRLLNRVRLLQASCKIVWGFYKHLANPGAQTALQAYPHTMLNPMTKSSRVSQRLMLPSAISPGESPA